MNSLKITFIVPNIEISGGIKAVFEFSNHLCRMGHNVSVVYPLLPMRGQGRWYNPGSVIGRGIGVIRNLKIGNSVDWFNLDAKLVRAPTLAERFITRADIVVATWWETAYFVSEYNKDKGEKFYLVQHYEIWGGPKEDVDRSYRLGLRNVVNSSWLKEVLEGLGAEVEALIPHAPDLEQFYPEDGEIGNEKIRILMPYRDLKWKGVEDGVRAFEITRKKHPEIQLVMFGPDSGKDVPCYAEFHKNPSNDELRRIYNSCDIFLFPSRTEGFGMPPMEAMACKCAVLTTNVGAVPDYTISGKTALIAPPNAPESLSEEILRLVEDKGLRTQLSQAGNDYIINNFTWLKSTEALEQLFIKVVKEKSRYKRTFKAQPLISVIIPCYNGEKFIRDAVESVFSQSYENLELIIVDDGSTDKSKDIIKQYTGDKRIKLIENECNKGIPKTKNIGLSAAKGEYVAFLDQDDVWMRTKLESQLRVFEQEDEVSVVCTGMILTDKNMKGREIFKGFDDSDQEELLKNLYLNPINSSSLMLIRRECISKMGIFDENLIGWDDYELLMRLATKFRVKYVRKTLVKKRVHSKSTHLSSAVFNEGRKVFKHVLRLHPFLKKYERTKEATLFFTEVIILLKKGERKLARQKLKKGMKVKLFYPMAWALYMISAMPGQSPKRLLATISGIISAINRMKLNFYRLY